MIKAINYGLAISDEGFKIRNDRDHISYIEGDYAIRIVRHIEKLDDPHTVSYNFEQLQGWFPPHEKEIITMERKEVIIKRIEEGLNILLNQGGYEYQIKRFGDKIIAIQKPLDRIKMAKVNKKKINEIKNKLP